MKKPNLLTLGILAAAAGAIWMVFRGTPAPAVPGVSTIATGSGGGVVPTTQLPPQPSINGTNTGIVPTPLASGGTAQTQRKFGAPTAINRNGVHYNIP